MTDLFADKAHEYDQRPIPAQISAGVFSAIEAAVPLSPDQVVLDFGAGTGLIAGKVASRVARVLAVDISESMLAQLASKPEMPDTVEPIRHDLLEGPLDEQVDLIVSAMAMHHVDNTAALLQSLFAQLRPGGRVALADLDAEDGSFHPPDIQGVFHQGFERLALRQLIVDAGFENVQFVDACEVDREERRYPIFLVTAQRPATDA
ncbi:MAG: class I SAM-dependent methyltransferase [Deltaproteobacteria bacterium]|nr:class I SAM-dependent methyltransferase [Deltaproteobacteria bacterium]